MKTKRTNCAIKTHLRVAQYVAGWNSKKKERKKKRKRLFQLLGCAHCALCSTHTQCDQIHIRQTHWPVSQPFVVRQIYAISTLHAALLILITIYSLLLAHASAWAHARRSCVVCVLLYSNALFVDDHGCLILLCCPNERTMNASTQLTWTQCRSSGAINARQISLNAFCVVPPPVAYKQQNNKLYKMFSSCNAHICIVLYMTCSVRVTFYNNNKSIKTKTKKSLSDVSNDTIFVSFIYCIYLWVCSFVCCFFLFAQYIGA